MTACGHHGQTCNSLMNNADPTTWTQPGARRRRTSSNMATSISDSMMGAKTSPPKTSAASPWDRMSAEAAGSRQQKPKCWRTSRTQYNSNPWPARRRPSIECARMKDVIRIGACGFSAGAICTAGTCSSGWASGSLFNSVWKQSPHSPRALTGVVHLLYFLPQALQKDTVRQV